MLRGTSPCAWSLPVPPPVETVGASAAVAGQEVVEDESSVVAVWVAEEVEDGSCAVVVAVAEEVEGEVAVVVAVCIVDLLCCVACC